VGLLESAAGKEPDNRAYRYHLARALVESGQEARAKRLLQELLSSKETFTEREQAQALLKRLES